MKSNKLITIFIALMILAIVGLGIYLYLNNKQLNQQPVQTIEEANKNAPPPPSIEETQVNTSATQSDPNAPEGCKIATKAMIMDKLALTVNDGISVKSPMANGTTCVLKKSDSSTGIIVQTFPEIEGSYNPSVWSNATQFQDIGEKAFVQEPANGVANAEAVKNGKVIYINIYSNESYTADQLKEFLIAVVAKV